MTKLDKIGAVSVLFRMEMNHLIYPYYLDSEIALK